MYPSFVPIVLAVQVVDGDFRAVSGLVVFRAESGLGYAEQFQFFHMHHGPVGIVVLVMCTATTTILLMLLWCLLLLASLEPQVNLLQLEVQIRSQLGVQLEIQYIGFGSLLYS